MATSKRAVGRATDEKSASPLFARAVMAAGTALLCACGSEPASHPGRGLALGDGGPDAGAESSAPHADSGGSDAAQTPSSDAGDAGGEALGLEVLYELDNPWCVAPSASSSYGFPSWAAQVSAAGVGWVRSFDGSKPANALTAASMNGLTLSGIFFYSATSPASFPVDDLPGLQANVSQRLAETQGKVLHWEVWNEPPNFSEDKSPTSYAQIVKAAYQRAKSVLPEVQIGLAAQSNNLNFLDQALLAGAAGHFDYVTLHPYELMDLVAHGWEGAFMGIVPTLRKMLSARDPGRAKAPVWFTEVGQPVGNEVSEDQQADTLVKAYVLSLAQGVARVCWFEVLDGDSGPFGLIAPQDRQRPSYIALATLIKELGTRVRYVGWLLLDDKHYAFVFQGATGPVMVTWAQPGKGSDLSFAAPVRRVDPGKNTSESTTTIALTSSPVLLAGISPTLLATARANQSRPFPWDGDYSQATSITFTAPDQSRGLHPLGTSQVRTIDGVSARDQSQVGAQSFTVDPNFTSYTSTSLRITAVLRRNGADSAGFNLKYEGVSGWKSTGAWFTIPAGDTWTTQSWTISDPQFVGKWGYHFSFDSDSPEHSKYSIRSVMLEKL